MGSEMCIRDSYYTVFGRYVVNPELPQRYVVDFYRGQIRGQNGESDENIRAAFGFDSDVDLDFDLKSPPLHSDIVYCDEDIRINFGSIGGKYILTRKSNPWLSVTPPKASR